MRRAAHLPTLLGALLTVLGYDPFNEPYDSFWTPTTVFDRKLECFYAGQAIAKTSCALTGLPMSQAPAVGIIPAIQAVDPNHLIFYETPITTDFSLPQTIGGLIFNLPFKKLLLNFHACGILGTGLGSGECATLDCAVQEDLTLE